MASKKSVQGRSKVVLEIDVLDEDTKNRIMRCIERRGKITVTMQRKVGAKALGAPDGGFSQQID